MTKTQELVVALTKVLDDSPVTQDEKIKALGQARTHLMVMKQAGIETHRGGPVGSGKKTEEIRKTMDEMSHKRSARKK